MDTEGVLGFKLNNVEVVVLNDLLALRQLGTGLRYDINATFALAATYFYTWGGETRVAGVAQNDRTQLERYQLTATANSPVGKLSLQYGGDFRTENGLLEDRRWVVRLTRFF